MHLTALDLIALTEKTNVDDEMWFKEELPNASAMLADHYIHVRNKDQLSIKISYDFWLGYVKF